MTAVRPRALVHHGCVHAAGMLVEGLLVGEEQARRRVLDAWTPGSRVLRLGGAYVVLWPELRTVAVDSAPAACLVRARGTLTAVPLAPRELDALSPPPDAVVIAREGEAHSEPLGEEVNPAAWIDVEGVSHETSSPLLRPPARDVRVGAQASAENVERALRASVGEPSAERALVSEALARGKAVGAGRIAAKEALGVGFQTMRSMLSAALSSLSNLLRRGPGLLGNSSSGSGASSSRGLVVQHAPAPSPRDAWSSRLVRALRHLAAQALLRLRLARFLGRAHAEYLARMLDFFERGDLDNALRYAIPLSGDATPDSHPALAPPRPRSSLALTAGSGQGGSVFLVDDFYVDLRRRYRAAFERLDKAGDVERAAFVLAELLRVSHEAVAYLEKHRRFALAAELAEARGLTPDHVVRLWFRAGQVRRAILLARAHGCFAIAVLRLEREDKGAAEALRLHWAESCASAGDYTGAARVAMEIAAAKGLVAGWIERAIETGGVQAAVASVMKLSVNPGAFEETRQRMQAVLGDPTALGEGPRMAFLQAIADSKAPAVSGLARAAVRAIAGDRAIAEGLLKSLLERAADSSLKLHALSRSTLQRPTLRPHAEESGPRRYTRNASDGAGLPVKDAALVAHGRLLVALGELGVRIVSLDGRTLARFDVPATSLVVSSHGDRALAVIPRDDALEVARIDVVRRRVQRWGLVTASAFARAFDGATWYVGRDAEVLAIDAALDEFDAVWQTTMGENARVQHVDARPQQLVVVGWSPESEKWVGETFDLPRGVLRHRVLYAGAVGGVGTVLTEEDHVTYGGIGVSNLCAQGDALARAHVDVTDAAWCVRGEPSPYGRSVVRLGRRAQEVVVETAFLSLPTVAGARLQDKAAVVFDASGRVLVLQLGDGKVLAEVLLRV